MNPVDGTGRTSLPAMAAALVAAEKTRRSEVGEDVRKASVGLSQRLNINVPREWAAGRAFKAKVWEDEGDARVDLVADPGGVAGTPHPDGRQQRLAFARLSCGKPPKRLCFSTAKADIVSSSDSHLFLRVSHDKMRTPKRNAPNSEKRSAPRQPVAPSPARPGEASQLRTKELVQELNRRVVANEDMVLVVTPEGRLRVMVEYE